MLPISTCSNCILPVTQDGQNFEVVLDSFSLSSLPWSMPQSCASGLPLCEIDKAVLWNHRSDHISSTKHSNYFHLPLVNYSPYHGLQIPLWSDHPLHIWADLLPLSLPDTLPHTTHRQFLKQVESINSMVPLYVALLSACNVFLPRATRLTPSHHALSKWPCWPFSSHSLSSPLTLLFIILLQGTSQNLAIVIFIVCLLISTWAG